MFCPDSICITLPTYNHLLFIFVFIARIFGEKNVKRYGGSEITITNPAYFPDPCIVSEFLEPMVMGTIITPGRRSSHVCSVEHT